MAEMLVRATRWFLIGAPMLAGILLLIFGTAGVTSQAFGFTLIAIAAMVWMWNWFIRMTFDDQARETETDEREQRAREQHLRLTSPAQPEESVTPERARHRTTPSISWAVSDDAGRRDAKVGGRRFYTTPPDTADLRTPR